MSPVSGAWSCGRTSVQPFSARTGFFSAEIKTQLLPPLMNTAGRHREREQRQGFGIQ